MIGMVRTKVYIQLYHRSYGLQTPIKHLETPCDFKSVYLSDNHINERLLLGSIPVGWLPAPSQMILMTVEDENGSTGQYNLSLFRPWAKYFDAYVLELLDKPLDWWVDSIRS